MTCAFPWEKKRLPFEPPMVESEHVASGEYNFPMDFNPDLSTTLCSAFSEKKRPRLLHAKQIYLSTLIVTHRGK